MCTCNANEPRKKMSVPTCHFYDSLNTTDTSDIISELTRPGGGWTRSTDPTNADIYVWFGDSHIPAPTSMSHSSRINIQCGGTNRGVFPFVSVSDGAIGISKKIAEEAHKWQAAVDLRNKLEKAVDMLRNNQIKTLDQLMFAWMASKDRSATPVPPELREIGRRIVSSGLNMDSILKTTMLKA